MPEPPTPSAEQSGSADGLSIIPAGLGAVFLLGALITAAAGVLDQQKAEALQSWPEVPAKVESAYSETQSTVVGPSAKTGGSFVTTRSWQVDGKSYSHTLRTFDLAADPHLGAKEGETVPYYYNPDDPSEAYGSRDDLGRLWVLFPISGVIALIALLLFYLAYRLRPRPGPRGAGHDSASSGLP